MLGICAATKWELRPVLRSLRDIRRVDVRGIRTWRALQPTGPVLLFRSGIGLDAANRVAEAVLAGEGLIGLLNTGVAGALKTDLIAGQLVIPDVLVDPTTPDPIHLPTDIAWTGRLRTVAAAARLLADTGPLMTSPGVLATVAEKRRAAALYGASAVEMEGSALATVAARYQIPFATVRAVLDDAGTNLPQFPWANRHSPTAEGEDDLIVHTKAIEKPTSFLSLGLALRKAHNALVQFFHTFNNPDTR